MDRKKTDEKHSLPRDVSWMYFNHRILREAMRPEVPLLERLSFLGIYSNNLDEFFRVRVATLNRVAECDDKAARHEREAAQAVLKQVGKLWQRYSTEFEKAVHQVCEALRRENIFLIDDGELDEAQRAFVLDFYRHRLNGLLSPLWLSAVKHLTGDTDEDIYLAVKMRRESNKKEHDYAVIELPVALCGRFVSLPGNGGRSYLMYLDDVVRVCLPLIFSGTGHTDFEAYAFKFTKDAEMEMDNDLRHGLLQKIHKGVKSRRRGTPLRVIYDARMPRELRKRITNSLELDKADTVMAAGKYHNHKDFMRFPNCGRADLRYPLWEPLPALGLNEGESILAQIRRKDRLLHVPYHSFDTYLRVLQEAAVQREVRSIRTTLYRLARDSRVVRALITAARNGKKVTVVIELLARFDEASNIGWSKQMQDAGIHVIFGVEGLKVHAKTTHIGLRTGADIACISTGNFHEGNARAYTDCLLLTASRNIVRDVLAVFRFIERPYTPVRFRELLVSPNEMKQKFVRLISEEIKNHEAGRPAYIRIKINHITAPEMVSKLYEAAERGVPVSLLVRGNCALLPCRKELGGNLRITGIIDRYLEHSRIFIFAAGGDERVYIGSADWMTRNLDNRVEVVTPVYDPDIKQELRRIVDYGLRDTRQGRRVDGTGRDPLPPAEEGAPRFRSQEELYRHYKMLAEHESHQ